MRGVKVKYDIDSLDTFDCIDSYGLSSKTLINGTTREKQYGHTQLARSYTITTAFTNLRANGSYNIISKSLDYMLENIDS